MGPSNEQVLSGSRYRRIILYSLAATDWFDETPNFLLIFRKQPSASQRPIEEFSIQSLWMGAEVGRITYNQLTVAATITRRAVRGRLSLN
jgi:hypothetical protein